MKKPERLIGESLREKGLKLALAESCTGGLLSSVVTGIAGSSDYFLGSVVSYANSVKESELGVKAKTLEKYGAVSAQTAKEMAVGAKKRLGADISAAITGIAGPGGGTPEKPIGLVFIAVAKGRTTVVERFLFKGARKSIREQAAKAALLLLVKALKD